MKKLWGPYQLVNFIIIVNVVLYLTAIALAPKSVMMTRNPMFFLTPAPRVLYQLGTTGTLPVIFEHRWWTIISANYLHSSLAHLVFNMAALRTLGRINIAIYAPSRFFLIYFLGGIISMTASALADIPVTLGASGAVCALIGAMSYDDWRAHKGNLRNRVLSVGVWVVFIALIGLLAPGVNNWAHATGFASGFVLGFMLWPRTTQDEKNLLRVTATLCMVITLAALLYGPLFGNG